MLSGIFVGVDVYQCIGKSPSKFHAKTFMICVSSYMALQCSDTVSRNTQWELWFVCKAGSLWIKCGIWIPAYDITKEYSFQYSGNTATSASLPMPFSFMVSVFLAYRLTAHPSLLFNSAIPLF